MYIAGDTTRFQGMWLIDSFPFKLVTSFQLLQNNYHHRVLPSRGKVVKRWPVRGYRKVGITAVNDREGGKFVFFFAS